MILGALSFGRTASAEQYLQVLPAVSVQNGSPVTVEYSLPCGAHLQGFLVNRTGRRLEISVVAKHNGFVCGSVQGSVRAQIPVKVPDGWELGTTRSQDFTDPVVRIPATEASVASIDGQAILQSEYVSECGRYLGIVLYPRGNDNWVVSHVEKAPSEEDIDDCEKGSRISEPLFLSRVIKVGSPSVQTSDLKQRYALIFAKVDKTSLDRSTHTFSLSFRRTCQDRPLGLVMSPDRTTIGVVVARFFNKTCHAAPRWERMESSAVTLPENKTRFFSAGREVFVKTPLAVQSDNGVFIKYSTHCNHTAGILMNETTSELRIGIVQVEAEKRCSKNLVESTLHPHFQRSVKKLKPFAI
ncbi:MAG: hypothetical protein AB7T49_03210 [Oligoflexales bacterium]